MGEAAEDPGVADGDADWLEGRPEGVLGARLWELLMMIFCGVGVPAGCCWLTRVSEMLPLGKDTVFGRPLLAAEVEATGLASVLRVKK